MTMNEVLNVEEPIIFQMPGSDQLDPKIAKRWMECNDTRLKPHAAHVPRAWQKLAFSAYRFPRGCFPRAIYFLRHSPHLPNALYVLGETNGGGIQQHGWVEIDDRVVFDGVMQQFYNKAGYYSVEMARPWYRFTRPAMMYLSRIMRKDPSLTYRWNDELHLPWASDPLNPLLVDLERAKEEMNKRRRQKAGIGKRAQ